MHIPRDHGLDHTYSMLRDPYRFISRRCREHGADVFEARIMLRPTICMTGREAAEVFYDPKRFMRRGAAMLRIQESLFGRGGVQTLDEAEHQHRKRFFLDILSPERMAKLVEAVGKQWHAFIHRWSSAPRVELYGELHELLTRAVCTWAGVPLREADIPERTRELTAMFDSAGAVGPPHWAARAARNRAEMWIMALIDSIRSGVYPAPEGSAAQRIAWFRDPRGALLDSRIAAVELLNVLRPTVAVSVYITHCAVALHCHPHARGPLERGGDRERTLFAQEVRRFYPFFPAATARVRERFEWHGYVFPRGRRVLLDLYGINHDERIWESPEEFRPERFAHTVPDLFDLVPQGGGNHRQHHRCPGEDLTLSLMKQATHMLVDLMSYDVPAQDLTIDYSRLPALAKSRFLMTNVRPAYA